MFKKSEIKYILLAVVFAYIYFAVVIPKVVSTGMDQQSPYFLFIVFNLGVFLFLQIFLKSFITNSFDSVKITFGLILLFIALDLAVAPPFLVAPDGVINGSAVLAKGSSDYIFGTIAIDLGLKGMTIYLFTYILIPALLLIGAASLIPDFVKHV